MGTRSDHSPHDAFYKAEPDEPMFTLIARDPMAASLVRAWGEARALAAADPRDLEKSEEARQCADAMEAWARDHPDHGILARQRDQRNQRNQGTPMNVDEHRGTMESLTDREHADAIASATDNFNMAVEAASKAGLLVALDQLRLDTTRSSTPYLQVTVSREL